MSAHSQVDGKPVTYDETKGEWIPDKRARGTIPRFIDLPVPDELLLDMAKLVNEATKEYWKEMEENDGFSFSGLTFEEIMKDSEAEPYVNYCFNLSQKFIKAYVEEVETAKTEVVNDQ